MFVDMNLAKVAYVEKLYQEYYTDFSLKHAVYGYMCVLLFQAYACVLYLLGIMASDILWFELIWLCNVP